MKWPKIVSRFIKEGKKGEVPVRVSMPIEEIVLDEEVDKLFDFLYSNPPIRDKAVPKTTTPVKPVESKRKTVPVITVPTYQVPYSPHPKEWFTEPWSQDILPSVAEQRIIDELDKYKVTWYREVSFRGLMLDTGYMRFDFWIPSLNLLIEYQGEQAHSTEKQLQKDNVKKFFCEIHQIRLQTYNKKHFYHIDDCIKSLMYIYYIKQK